MLTTTQHHKLGRADRASEAQGTLRDAREQARGCAGDLGRRYRNDGSTPSCAKSSANKQFKELQTSKTDPQT